jgi:CheY-like chemotaxis protein
MLNASKKGIALTYEVPDDPELVWRSDAGALRQILINLVGNAIKFTEHGQVQLCVAHQDKALIFAISDTGLGIPENLHKTIFEPFRQADGSTNKRHEGTGLGLAISARLVALMGGKIWLDSTVSSGSTFYFTLPAMADSIAPTATPDTHDNPLSESPDPLCILLVEDNEINQMVTQRILESRKHNVFVAESAEKGIALYKERLFDIVLMDLQMPDMDGFAAAEAIRALERDQKRVETPILAVTAHAMDGYYDASLAAGMNGFISKPFMRDVFLKTVEQTVGKGYRRDGTGQPQSAVAEPPKSSQSVFDREKALEQVSGDTVLFRKMCRAFYDKCPGILKEIRVALEAGELGRVESLLHRLKGGVGTFFASDAHRAASHLEELAKQTNHSGVCAYLPVFEGKLEELHRALVEEGLMESA